jgi:hypothetical protein
MLEKFAEAAKSFLGITDWVEDLEPAAPVLDTPTIAVTHAYRNSGSMDFASDDDRGGYERLEWLELRRNDSAAPFFTSDKPTFAFFGDYQAICRDGSKFPMAMLNTVRAPEGLEPAKYTLFRREVTPKDPTVAAYFFMDVMHGEAIYKTEIAQKNMTLEQGLAAMKAFEISHTGMRMKDTVNPGNKHYVALAKPVSQPVPLPA